VNRRRLRARLRRRQRQERLQRSGPWIAACGLLAVLWLAIASSIFAPPWAVGLYIAVVLVLIPRLVRMARTEPARSVWVPAYAVAGWLIITAAGVMLGGWAQ